MHHRRGGNFGSDLGNFFAHKITPALRSGLNLLANSGLPVVSTAAKAGLVPLNIEQKLLGVGRKRVVRRAPARRVIRRAPVKRRGGGILDSLVGLLGLGRKRAPMKKRRGGSYNTPYLNSPSPINWPVGIFPRPLITRRLPAASGRRLIATRY